jgi:Zn-dependent protease
MQELNIVQLVAVWALPTLFAITVHEVAHGWVARRLGDPTAMMLGRLTLNPLKHIDLIGTVAVPILLLVLSSGHMVFGWAKPVPITAENLRPPKKGMAAVAAAGPLANLMMALLWALLVKLIVLGSGGNVGAMLPLIYMGLAGITINVLLMILNLIPVPPLDGSRVVAGFLPDPLAWKYGRLEQYGLLILLALMATGLLGRIMGPPMSAVQDAIYRLFGI